MAIRTESTKNGISLVIISTIVCDDCQPSFATSGLKTRITASSVVFFSSEFQRLNAAPYRSLSLRFAKSSLDILLYKALANFSTSNTLSARTFFWISLQTLSRITEAWPSFRVIVCSLIYYC